MSFFASTEKQVHFSDTTSQSLTLSLAAALAACSSAFLASAFNLDRFDAKKIRRYLHVKIRHDLNVGGRNEHQAGKVTLHTSAFALAASSFLAAASLALASLAAAFSAASCVERNAQNTTK